MDNMFLTVKTESGSFCEERLYVDVEVPSLNDDQVRELEDDIIHAQPQWLEQVNVQLGEDVTVVATVYDKPPFPNTEQLETIGAWAIELVDRHTR